MPATRAAGMRGLRAVHLLAAILAAVLPCHSDEGARCPEGRPAEACTANGGSRRAGQAGAVQQENLLLQVPGTSTGLHRAGAKQPTVSAEHTLAESAPTAGQPSSSAARTQNESAALIRGEWPDNSAEHAETEAAQAEGRSPLEATSAHVPLPLPPQAQPAHGLGFRLATFNVYYKELATPHRVDRISTAIVDLHADIAVITESWNWNGKDAILGQVRAKSGRNYVFCNGGNFQNRAWDGDILYDADHWTVLADDVVDLGQERGMSWASMQHKATGKKLLVYGMHPLCCGNEQAHLENAMVLGRHLLARPEYPDAPAVIMGDFNAFENWYSTWLYKGAQFQAYGRTWKLPMAFDDAFRMPPGNRHINGNTYNAGYRFDYIFLEKRHHRVFQTLNSWIWRSAPGYSDHYPLVADVVLA